MSTLLLLTSALQPSAEVAARARAPQPPRQDPARRGQRAARGARADLVLVDGRQELAHARDLCRLIRTTGVRPAGAADRHRGRPRRRLARLGHGRRGARTPRAGRARGPDPARASAGCAARATTTTPRRTSSAAARSWSTTRRTPPSSAGRTLDLTFKEFELLKYLAQHPGRVFSREQLLQEVWGYDYFGGTRTVDVHVRRLRAKLGPENEALIGTVRNVGYRFVLPPKEAAGRGRPGTEAPLTSWCKDRSRRLRLAPRRRRPGRRRTPIAAAADAEDGVVSLNEAAHAAAEAPRPRGRRVLHVGRRRLRRCWPADDLDVVVTPSPAAPGVGTRWRARSLAGVDRRGRRLVARRPPGGGRIAARLGLPRERELWVMARP